MYGAERSNSATWSSDWSKFSSLACHSVSLRLCGVGGASQLLRDPSHQGSVTQSATQREPLNGQLECATQCCPLPIGVKRSFPIACHLTLCQLSRFRQQKRHCIFIVSSL